MLQLLYYMPHSHFCSADWDLPGCLVYSYDASAEVRIYENLKIADISLKVIMDGDSHLHFHGEMGIEERMCQLC